MTDTRNWLTEKVVPLLKDHVDPENLYHVADHIADALLEHTYTESDMRVLTEAALRLGRKEAAEEIAVAIEARADDGSWNAGGMVCLQVAANIARDIGKGDPTT